MADLDRFAAQVLEAGASGYSMAAAHRLLVSRPAVSERYGRDALQTWKVYLTQISMELAAAVRFDSPELFVAGIDWQRNVFVARHAERGDLEAALKALRETLDAELPGNAREPVIRCIDAALAAPSSANRPRASEARAREPQAELVSRYIAACLEGREQASALILEDARRTLSDAELYLQVLLPAQEEIGRRWHMGETGVVEEHIVSETTRHLTALLSAAPRRATTGKTVLTAAVAGNAHDIGIRAVADFFRFAGWHCIALGANVPAAEIAESAREFQADVVALSATLTTQLVALEESIVALRELDRNVAILVGGHAFDRAPQLWRRLGADGYAVSPDEALERAAELLGIP